jgi:hypothetical protein
MADHSTTPQRRASLPISNRAITSLVLVAIALTFIVQNRQIVAILLFIPTVVGPLWAALAGVFVVGFGAGYLLAWRRR